MTTTAGSPQIVPRPPASLPALRAADNTRRVYGAHVVHFTAAVYSGVGGRVGGFGFQDALH